MRATSGAATRARALLCAAVGLGAPLASCVQDRASAPGPPGFVEDVAPVLDARCVSCHGGSSPAAGWNAGSYLSAIACLPASGSTGATGATGAAATLPPDGSAPVLAALETAPHVGLLSAEERSTLASWVAAGAPGSRGGVHDPGFADPRSGAFHGASLRAARWAPMLDPDDAGACGRCHDGAPSRPSGVAFAAPGAPACTGCHDQPSGALACGTCHGTGSRAYPPRDPCFFPADAARSGAHAAHVEPSSARASGLACSTCHPVPASPVIGGLHGNGSVEIVFDPALVPGEASYDPASGVCAVSCHDRGGARPRPAWNDARPMRCGDCHASPPAGHFPGPCAGCHREANADGTALSGGPLHLDGRVDLGDGSGGCGACHGQGDSPWPDTGAHASHRDPTLATPIACSSCHVVPAAITDPGHMNGTVDVAFSGLAAARNAVPTWDGTRCAGVACHGAGLADPAAAPSWTDLSGAEKACGACHGAPPSQHTSSTSCDRADCHGGEVSIDAAGRASITATGTALHVDGVIESAR